MSAAINQTHLPMWDDPLPDAQPSSPVVPVGALNDWQIAALKKILGFGKLAENWDSYGSRAISHGVVFAAIKFLGQAALENAPPVTVLPVSGGAIQFEWEKGARALEFEVRPDGAIFYLAVENGEPLAERRLEAPADAGYWLSWLSVG